MWGYLLLSKGEADEGATLPNCLTRVGNPVNCSRNYYGLDMMPVALAAWPQTIVDSELGVNGLKNNSNA